MVFLIRGSASLCCIPHHMMFFCLVAKCRRDAITRLRPAPASAQAIISAAGRPA